MNLVGTIVELLEIRDTTSSKASVKTTFQASHSYPSILCNISELAVLHDIEQRVRFGFGRKDQSPVLLLYITFIVARHTY
mmetsp:Transcript_23222/g.36301  ORF Transcript_23222/g.36301 Transcript_23222/m.36301 type:complete len:80 (+) Transcript_23222:91-330(+)